MDALLHIIEAYGLWVVFICVLLDQGGLPVPAYPPMIVTAALAWDARESQLPILIVATAAALAADLAWFAGGRKFGAALLRLMCRISLSPDSCVGSTRRIYARWGAPSLILAKYIPGSPPWRRRSRVRQERVSRVSCSTTAPVRCCGPAAP